MAAYFEELRKAMSLLCEDHRVIFIGQGVSFPGTGMFKSLEHLPPERRIELPVMENSQLGMAIGASLTGDIPVCVYPRINFLLEAMSQLVSHLDKMPLFSGYKPKVIIRTAIAHKEPLDPGPQHLGNYGNAIKSMLSTVKVVYLPYAENIVPAYEKALNDEEYSSIMIEYMELYNK